MPGGEDVLLELRGLGVFAAGTPLLAGLDLSLRAGEIVALSGPSGAGKTSLLRAVAGLSDPAEGVVWLRGRSPEEHGWPAFRRRVAFLHQTPVTFATTVEQNLRRPFDYATAEAEYPAERAARLLERLGLGSALERFAPSLSVGERQRLGLVRLLLVAPEVALLDEPTSALDRVARDAVEDLLREEVADRGLAALVVTHDEEQAARLADRALDLAAYRVSGAAHA